MIKNTLENLTRLNILVEYLPSSDSEIKCCIAGGCFKNIFNFEKVKDIDIFSETKKDFEQLLDFYKNNEDFKEIFVTTNVVCFQHIERKIRVDLVKSTFNTPENIINNFDFTITKMAMFYGDKTVDILNNNDKKMKIIYHDEFFEHLHNKKLVIDDKIPFVASTFNRILRYTKYGYNLCRMSKIKFLNCVRELQLNESLAEILPKELYESFD